VQRDNLPLLKRFSQSPRSSKSNAPLEDLRVWRPLYQEVAPVGDALDVPPQGVRDYANAVLKSRLFQGARRAEDDRHRHLVCFIAPQFLWLHAVLIDTLLLAVQSPLHACEREHKERYYTRREEPRQAVQTVGEKVTTGLGNPLAEMATLAGREQLTDTEKVCHIQAVRSQGEAQRHSVESHRLDVHQQFQESQEDSAFCDGVESKSLQLPNRVADMVKALAFPGDEHAALHVALPHYQQKHGVMMPTAPVDFLAAYEQWLLVDASGKLCVSLDKSLLFIKLAEAIKAGTISLKHSYKYRSLAD
jgi:hypothetical protein